MTVVVMEAVLVAVLVTAKVLVSGAALKRLEKPMTGREESGTREMKRSVVFALF